MISETLPAKGDPNWDVPLNAKLLELIRNANAVHNVIQYGATGNGSTDDTVAIQAAITACAATKGIVFIPHGIYATSSALTISSPSVRLVGAGRDATKIRSTVTTGNMITIDNAAVYASVESLTLTRITAAVSGNGIQVSGTGEAGYVTFRDLYIEKQNRGFYSGPCTFGWIEDVTCAQNTGDAFFFTNNTTTGALQYQISDCLAQLNDGIGFRVFSQNIGASQITLGTWQNISTFGNTGYGISLEGHASCPIHDFRLNAAFLGEDSLSEVRMDTYGGGHMINGTFTELTGSRTTGSSASSPATGTGHGIELTANNNDLSISGGKHMSNSQCGIFLSGGDVVITGTQCVSNGQSATAGATSNSGIYVGGGDVVVTGTMLKGSDYGLYINSDTVSASGNRLSGTTSALGAGVTLTNSIVDSSRGADVWSTWAPTVGGFTGTPTTVARYKRAGRVCTIFVSITGTSNATTFTFTLPFAAESAVTMLDARIADAGATASTPGQLALTAASSTATVTRDGAGTAWTSSGTKTLYGYSFTYEVD